MKNRTLISKVANPAKIGWFLVLLFCSLIKSQTEIIWEYGEPAKWQKMGFRVDMSAPDNSPANQTPLSAVLWKQNGFNTPEEAVMWASGSSFSESLLSGVPKGFGPQASRLWKTGGFNTPEEAVLWFKNGFKPKTGAKWKKMKANPKIAARYKDLDMSFNDAYAWYKALVPPEDIEVWEKYGYSPKEAKLWSKYKLSPQLASLWMEKGFSPSQAAPWLKAGFRENPEVAINWKGSKLTRREAYQAYRMGFVPEDFLEWEEGSSLLFAAMARDSKSSVNEIIASFKEFRDTVDYEKLKDGDELGSLKARDIKGGLYALILDKKEDLKDNQGLYSLVNDPEVVIHIDFEDIAAPQPKLICYGFGTNPYEYSIPLGGKLAMHSMIFGWGHQISDETWQLVQSLKIDQE